MIYNSTISTLESMENSIKATKYLLTSKRFLDEQSLTIKLKKKAGNTHVNQNLYYKIERGLNILMSLDSRHSPLSLIFSISMIKLRLEDRYKIKLKSIKLRAKSSAIFYHKKIRYAPQLKIAAKVY